MTEKSLGIIVKHFCLDSLDESAANKDVLLFPPQSLNSVVIMNIFLKNLTLFYNPSIFSFPLMILVLLPLHKHPLIH